ncbi:MAG TPA: phenylacetate--CoA ligase [Methylomirabilota bacterium]|nr:phenylacetate--CoA ligase [Methylomirabilota bacterium]
MTERAGLAPAMWDAAAESRPREALERQILAGMRRTLGRVLGHAAWRRRLAGVEVGDLRSTADWSRLPFLTKDELRDAYPFGLACAPRDRVLRVHMSSGTTGNPVLNPYTRADVEQWGALMARCYVTAGVGARDVVQITPSFGLFTGGFGFHYGAERIGATVVPIGAGRTSLQLSLMRDLGATVLAGISTYPLRILEVARDERFDLRSLRLRVAILGSEMWSDALRALIERELGVTTFDIIGMTETGGPGLGIDCGARVGIHVWEDHYVCEVVDPATGRPRADGEEGELIVSTLTREGLPLIRYRTHDLTRVLSRGTCACGRTHLRLDRLHGRTDDMVIFRGVNFYPRQIESLLLQQAGAGPEYQIVLDRVAGGSDRLTLLLEAGEGFAENGLPRLRRELRERLNLSPEITLLKAGEIPRAPGKAVRVVDRR